MAEGDAKRDGSLRSGEDLKTGLADASISNPLTVAGLGEKRGSEGSEPSEAWPALIREDL